MDIVYSAQGRILTGSYSSPIRIKGIYYKISFELVYASWLGLDFGNLSVCMSLHFVCVCMQESEMYVRQNGLYMNMYMGINFTLQLNCFVLLAINIHLFIHFA